MFWSFTHCNLFISSIKFDSTCSLLTVCFAFVFSMDKSFRLNKQRKPSGSTEHHDFWCTLLRPCFWYISNRTDPFQQHDDDTWVDSFWWYQQYYSLLQCRFTDWSDLKAQFYNITLHGRIACNPLTQFNLSVWPFFSFAILDLPKLYFWLSYLGSVIRQCVTGWYYYIAWCLYVPSS
jgi:hypothetical protein